MRTPKKWLQDWLGITSLAVRIAEMDIEKKPELSVMQQDTFMVFSREIGQEEIKKGYES